MWEWCSQAFKLYAMYSHKTGAFETAHRQRQRARAAHAARAQDELGKSDADSRIGLHLQRVPKACTCSKLWQEGQWRHGKHLDDVIHLRLQAVWCFSAP